MPPIAAMVPAIANTATRILLTRMPARRAASAFPPTAKMWRPKRVRVTTNSPPATKPTRMSTASGTPRAAFITATAAITPAATTAMRNTTVGSGWVRSPAAIRRR